MLNALKAINDVSDAKTDENTIEMLVPTLWPQLEEKLDRIPDKEDSGKHMRPQTEILEDLVSQVRGLGARMRDFDPEMMERDLRSRDRKFRKIHHFMFEEIMMLSGEGRENDMALLMIAGLMRDTMPWLSEVLVEGYRDIKAASPREVPEIANRLMRVVKVSTRSPLAERMMDDSKGAHMLMMELPHLIDRAISYRVEISKIIENRFETIHDDDDEHSESRIRE